jgi:cell division protein FtsZ
LSVVQPAAAAQPLQMLRTGTDNLPMMGAAVAATTASAAGLGGTPSQPPVADYAGLSTPSVWRSARTKVEALASNGMDEIDIPAFLRKQAD